MYNLGPRSQFHSNFLCSTHISTLFDLVINFKMPTIVGILKFMSRTDGRVYCSEQKNCLTNFNFDNYEDSENHAQVSGT